MDIIREPQKIEEKSMAIIEEYLQGLNLNYGEKQVVKRVIHATGDPSYAQIMVFSPGAVEKGISLLSQGKDLITDVEMVRVGINKNKLKELEGEASCFIHHSEVIKGAGEEGITRAAYTVSWAREKINGNIMVIGNAPTFLFALLDSIKKSLVSPAFIIGAPVGFVGSSEAKEELEKQDIVPFITLRGIKGGSPVAVSIVNALLKMSNPSQG